MKKILKSLVVLLTIITLFACDTKDELVIGISKIVAHPALDAVEKGIQDELNEKGIVARYDLQNAFGEITNASSIASKFKQEKVDYAVGIATPTAQALVNTVTDSPVIFSAVTDPVAAGLVESFTIGDKNVTGTSDLTPVKEQIKLLIDLTGATKIGHIYSSGEANATLLANMAKDACAELGVEFIESTVTKSSEVREAALALVSRVDAIYVSTDNTVVSVIASVSDVATRNGIPIMSADPSSSKEDDILVAWGFDYYKMGRATGRIIYDLINGKTTSEIPTKFMTATSDIQLLLNLDVAKELGITIPAELIESAAFIVENEELTEK